MRPAPLVGAVLLCVPGVTVVAQTQAPVPQPGERVRLTAPCGRAACSFEGKLVAARADTITLATEESTTRYHLSAVSRLDVSRGYRSRRLAGAGIGFVVGTAVTFLLLHTGGSTSVCDRSANQDAIRPEECLGLAALGGVAGAGLGAIVGGLVRTERWQEVPLERLRVGPRGQGSVEFGLSVTLP